MLIERLTVKEGYLDGLDLKFSEGLNVLIGPRGAGKSAILELIRYCLNAPSFSQRAQDRARQHALAVLQSGEVVLTCRHGAQRIKIVRTAGDTPSIQTSPNDLQAIVLSQGEVEEIGRDSRGRVLLLDRLSGVESLSGRDDRDLLAAIRSVGAEIRTAIHEITAVDDQLHAKARIEQELAEAKTKQTEFLKHSKSTQKQQTQLRAISQEISTITQRLADIGDFEGVLTVWLEHAQETPDFGEAALASIPKDTESAQQFSALIAEATENFNEGATSLAELLQLVSTLSHALGSKMKTLEGNARQLRLIIDQESAGAGEVAQIAASLQAQLDSLGRLAAKRSKQMVLLSTLQERRSNLLGELESRRQNRFATRTSTAARLGERLSPMIEVTARHLAELDQYVDAIVGMLRGGNVHYNTLAPRLASSLTPVELALAIETGQAEVIAEAAGIDMDRARKVIAQGQRAGTSDILACEIEDAVSIGLLVGHDYRPTEKLSVGQRCTAILPLLLATHDRPLVIDQPEDNLDNAFIVSTVIRAIRERPSDTAQIICATHNPNIPVLGDSSTVVHMDSDGRRGFVRSAAPLGDARTVEAISSIMEGGREAFRLRAEFYESAP
jgi:ABC-type lipoprotein export system ATPase subunit